MTARRSVSPSSEGDPLEGDDLRELFRQEAEGITERLDVLVGAGTPEAAVEALRLAHTLKGLAVSTESHALRDLARSLESALVGFTGDDQTRRGQLLSAIDAARGLVTNSPDAPGAARVAAATLQQTGTRARKRGVPFARRALLRRLLRRAPGLLEQLDQRLHALGAGVDDQRARRRVGRAVELWGAGLGLAGSTTPALLALELAAFLFERTPTAPAQLAARGLRDQLTARLQEPEAVDVPLDLGVLSAVEALRANTSRRPDEERVVAAIELPWPDVDDPADLLTAIERAAAGRAVLDARPLAADSRFLQGAIGVAPARRRGRGDQGFVKVPQRRLDRLVRRAEELVAAKSRARDLSRLAKRLADGALPGARLGLHRLARLASEHERELDHLARSTQQAALRARLVTVRGLFALARMTVREYASRHSEAAVEVAVEGAQTEIDKATLDALVEPLLHLIKNALIHGVEPREERAAQGKPEVATLTLRARAGPAGVTLEVEDDGRGMDTSLLVEREAARDLPLPRDEGSGEHVFTAGVSTAPAVTDDAGRGVGLATVLERVRALRGRLAFRSQPGRGTRARLVIPPAVATARVLLVRAGAEQYALPLASVRGVVEAYPRGAPGEVARLEDLVGPGDGSERRRMRLAPERERRRRDRFAVRIAPLVTHDETGHEALWVVVDDVLRRDLVVVRPLGQRFAHPGVDGAALFGDGRLVLVIDAWRLHASRRAGGAAPGEE